MALQIQVTQIEASGQQINLTFNVVPSGNYPAGGDTVDFTKAVAAPNLLNPAWPGAIETSLAPVQLGFWSQNGNLLRQYAPILGTTLTNGKMKVSASAVFGTELAAGAYPADVTGDVITGTATFNKLI